MRCLKCQRWGHMAKDCRETSDTCGTCAENHRMNTCTAYKTLRCANCDSKTHGSWSRQCPEFLQHCHDLNTHTPKNQMLYFPTDEAWMQVLRPPKAPGNIIPTRTPTHSRAPTANKHSRQMVLEEHTQHRHPTHNRAQSHIHTSSQCSGRSGNPTAARGARPAQGKGERSPSLPPLHTRAHPPNRNQRQQRPPPSDPTGTLYPLLSSPTAATVISPAQTQHPRRLQHSSHTHTGNNEAPAAVPIPITPCQPPSPPPTAPTRRHAIDRKPLLPLNITPS